jgi:hypothetical protein
MRLMPLLLVALVACKARHEPAPRDQRAGSGSSATSSHPAKTYDAIARADFNRWAVRQNLPVYWIADSNANQRIDPYEVAALLFYATEGDWSHGPAFTAAFDKAYDQIVAASKAQGPTGEDARRRELVAADLDQGRPTLVRSDFTSASADDKAFVGHMLTVAHLIDQLYEKTNGAAALASRLPADPESRSLFRRNRGPKCAGPATEKQPECSAIPGAPKPTVDVYPSELQKSETFCKDLEARKDAKSLLEPFTAVRGDAAKLIAVPFSDAYKDETTAIAKELTAAADTVKDPSEPALVTYLRAAAKSFTTNDWLPADEAWAKMTVDNSKWFVRVGPDEVYWEPCSRKAGFHLTFARINQGSKDWQRKLVPVQQEMEAKIAERAGAPYTARTVTFHLPDFVDIIVYAGDDRQALTANIGQSLPNVGPVASEGRGRTIAMVNLYTDPDSLAARRAQAESLLDAASMSLYPGTAEPGLLTVILHEATHNLGPMHEYKVRGKIADEVFGGPTASMLEELKAETGALFLLEVLRSKGIIPDQLAQQTYAAAIVWGFGQISQGTGSDKTYGNVAAIQIGFMIERGVLTWDDKAAAANGRDQGAFTIHTDKLVAVSEEMMKTFAGIKARGDKAAADDLIKRYVDGTVVPQKLIAERFRRFAKASFVYAVSM